jgi:hypothetical protein
VTPSTPIPSPNQSTKLPELERWLAAEAADAPRAEEALDASPQADEALVALFAAVPRPSPRPGFADRVLARALPAAVPGVRRRALAWLLAALAGATALVLVPWLLGPVTAALSGGTGVTGFLADGVARASQLLAGLLLALDKLFELARGFAADSARNPALAGGVLVALGLAASALLALQRTLSRERMLSYALR